LIVDCPQTQAFDLQSDAVVYSLLKRISNMRHQVVATDYDGTLAEDGHVDAATIDALKRVLASGRRLILVTGRIIEQIRIVFPEIALCDLVVADNGAMLFNPKTEEVIPLAEPPNPEFVQALMRRGVTPLEIGSVIVATWVPHETTVLETIRDLGLELQIIFNKGAVMVLPTGINKATGLTAALEQLGYRPEQTVGIGDAENDEAFLKLCHTSVAVSNALDAVKARVHFVTTNPRSAGVVEMLERLLQNDLADVHPPSESAAKQL
jgi:hydroxymethylpyrimidine pyrophosphatase-like HAD family hydrolase